MQLCSQLHMYICSLELDYQRECKDKNIIFYIMVKVIHSCKYCAFYQYLKRNSVLLSMHKTPQISVLSSTFNSEKSKCQVWLDIIDSGWNDSYQITAIFKVTNSQNLSIHKNSSLKIHCHIILSFITRLIN